jgi:hypothetical protein
MPEKSIERLLREARSTLDVHTDVSFARFLGVSRRTVQRHASQDGFPDGGSRAKFVRALFPLDPVNARVIAGAFRVDLSDLEPEQAATPVPTVGREHMAMLTLAVSDALSMLPRDVRPLLATVFGEALALGVDLNELASLMVARATKDEPA